MRACACSAPATCGTWCRTAGATATADPELVDVAHALRPGLVVTVDNGISSVEGVARAKELGIGVLITDHHLPGEQLPAADAIVNPNRPADGFPSKCLAGVGVMFYVLGALRARRRRRAAGGNAPNLASLLDLVALGTVADVVPSTTTTASSSSRGCGGSAPAAHPPG